MYGIYDMSGGAIDYVMGVMLYSDNQTPCSGTNAENNSGFNGPYCFVSGTKTDGLNLPEKKYYDSYAYSTVPRNFYRRILGDATGEMGPFEQRPFPNIYVPKREVNSWDNADSWMTYLFYPWVTRGGYFNEGNLTSILAFACFDGSASNYSYRIVLSV